MEWSRGLLKASPKFLGISGMGWSNPLEYWYLGNSWLSGNLALKTGKGMMRLIFTLLTGVFPARGLGIWLRNPTLKAWNTNWIPGNIILARSQWRGCQKPWMDKSAGICLCCWNDFWYSSIWSQWKIMMQIQKPQTSHRCDNSEGVVVLWIVCSVWIPLKYSWRHQMRIGGKGKQGYNKYIREDYL